MIFFIIFLFPVTKEVDNNKHTDGKDDFYFQEA